MSATVSAQVRQPSLGFADLRHIQQRYAELFQVLRLWRLPVDDVLASGLGTLPLAPVANNAAGVVNTIDRMRVRTDDRPRAEYEDLWSATYLLMGLIFTTHQANELLKGVKGLRESATYQDILREGREIGGRESEAMWRAS